jgi:hypothetical protein
MSVQGPQVTKTKIRAMQGLGLSMALPQMDPLIMVIPSPSALFIGH